MCRPTSPLKISIAGLTLLNVAAFGFSDEVNTPTISGSDLFAPGFSTVQGGATPNDGAPDENPSNGDDPPVEPSSPPQIGPNGQPRFVSASSASAADAAPGAKSAGAKPKPQGPSPAQKAYKGVYYHNDFSYLSNPNNDVPWYPGDWFKQLAPTPNSVLDMGGEVRLRDQHEFKMRNSGPVGSNLKGLSDDFLLERERLFVNFRYGDSFRFYGETINATESFNRDTPRNIEVNPWDALNLFVDIKFLDTDKGEAWARGGRQELLYGAQRLVSPLDWSNTRRTFDGCKAYWTGETWNVDTFWTRPVLPGQHIINSTGPTTGDITSTFDHPDSGQQFFGLYSSYKAVKDHTIEFYYLGYDEDKAPNPENAIYKTNFHTNTIGTHVLGKQSDLLYEVEGGYQFGTWGSGKQSAGFLVLGSGYQFSQQKWKPTFWTYYDWASGNADPNSANHGTFNQLVPFSHKYFGYMDLVARQNIRDLNFQLTATPTNKLTLLTWFHIFQLDQAKDSLYNAQGLAIRTDATGRSGRNVGQEIDLTAQYQINARTDVLFGYSYFFAGSFVRDTNPAGVSGNADFYYSQWSWRF